MKKLLVSLIALFVVFSCQKPDRQDVTSNVDSSEFFKLPSASHPIVGIFAEAIRNDSKNFSLTDLIENHGYILWDRAEVIEAKEGEMSIMPVAKKGAKEVDGFVLAKRDRNNNFMFQLYSHSDIEFYPTWPNGKFLTTNTFQGIVNHFNREIFSDSTFRYPLISMLPGEFVTKFPDKLDRRYLFGKSKSSDAAPRVTSSCFTYYEEEEVWYDPDGSSDPCDCSGNEIYLYTKMHARGVCWPDPFVPAPGQIPNQGIGYWGSDNGGGSIGGGGITASPPSITKAQYLRNKAQLTVYEENYVTYNNYALRDGLYELVKADYDTREVYDEIIPVIATQEAIAATHATISAWRHNVQNQFNANHFTAVNKYYPSQIIIPLMEWLNLHVAIYKVQNPSWSYVRCYWEATKEIVHICLDGVGLFPGIGEVADVANGVIYTLEGDGANAAFSYSAAIPITGWVSTAAKYAYKSITTAAGGRTALKWIRTVTGSIEFGDRGQLRRVLGLTNRSTIAHHIIPWQWKGHPLVQQAAKAPGASPFHLNQASNGIGLSDALHVGSHGDYNQRVLTAMEDILSNNPSITPAQAITAINNLCNRIRTAIINNPNVNINNLVF